VGQSRRRPYGTLCGLAEPRYFLESGAAVDCAQAWGGWVSVESTASIRGDLNGLGAAGDLWKLPGIQTDPEESLDLSRHERQLSTVKPPLEMRHDIQLVGRSGR
jgi:hypothetical protein